MYLITYYIYFYNKNKISNFIEMIFILNMIYIIFIYIFLNILILNL